MNYAARHPCSGQARRWGHLLSVTAARGQGLWKRLRAVVVEHRRFGYCHFIRGRRVRFFVPFDDWGRQWLAAIAGTSLLALMLAWELERRSQARQAQEIPENQSTLFQFGR